MGAGPEEEGLLESEKVNVVPLADLTLVLLIILMVLGPLVSRSMIRVSTPEIKKGAGAAAQTDEREPVVILLTEKGWRLEDAPVDAAGLGPALKDLVIKEPDRSVVVASAGGVSVEDVVRAVDTAKMSGARRVALARSGE